MQPACCPAEPALLDFPLIGNEGAVSFLADSHLSDEDKDKIAHGNADKLLGLDQIR